MEVPCGSAGFFSIGQHMALSTGILLGGLGPKGARIVEAFGECLEGLPSAVVRAAVLEQAELSVEKTAEINEESPH